MPALIVRRATTTVELRDGQSFVIAGLLQSDQHERDQQQLPWLGDVPVLGALFRSASYQKNETDLVIIVTPRLVRPARPGDVLKTPLDNSLPANDVDFFLHGQGRRSPRRWTRRSRAAPTAGALRSATSSIVAKGGTHVSIREFTRARASLALAAATLLGGCSDMLLRPPRHRHASAPATRSPPTTSTQMIDPWPAASGNRNIAFNGEKMQRRRRALSHRPASSPPVNGTAPARPPTPAARSRRSPRPTARRRRRRRSGQQVDAAPDEKHRCERPSHRARRTRPWWRCSPPTPAFEQLVRATFGASGADRAARGRRHVRRAWTASSTPTARPSSSSISTPAAPGRDGGAAAPDDSARRLAAGGRRDPELRRGGRAAAAADAGRGFPGQAGAAGRAGAHLRARRARRRRRRRPTEAQIYTFLPAVGGVGVTTLAIQTALLLLNSGQRGTTDDLPGRSRFPARRLRRLSRPRAAPRPRARSSRARSGSTGSCSK